MKKGDLVMFTGTGRYAKWFFGHMAIIENYTPRASDGKAHCRVRWINPVPYFSDFATVSDFSADEFSTFQ